MLEIIPNWHPIWVKIAIGLLFGSGLFYLLWAIKPEWKDMRIVGRWTLWFGALAAMAAVASGFIAYNTVAHDGLAHPVMLTHRNWALVTLAVFIALAAWVLIRYLSRASEKRLFAVALLVGIGLLFTTAWYGSHLVYKHGLGVERLPEPGEHDHGHGHGDDHGHDHGHDEADNDDHDHEHNDEDRDDHDHDHD
jgi:uncharacterized membrane protein